MLVKWFYFAYKIRFLELDVLTNQTYEKNNRIDWKKTNCCLCDFKLSVGASFESESEKMAYLDFIIKKEHLIQQNIFDIDVLKK